MTRRLLVGYLAVTVIVLLILEVPLAVFYSQRERERFATAVERDASVLATLYEDSLEKQQPPDAAPAEQYAAAHRRPCRRGRQRRSRRGRHRRARSSRLLDPPGDRHRAERVTRRSEPARRRR